jgi:hypothetical protein
MAEMYGLGSWVSLGQGGTFDIDIRYATFEIGTMLECIGERGGSADLDLKVWNARMEPGSNSW